MPQPRFVGRVTDTDSHALFISINANEVSPTAYEVCKMVYTLTFKYQGKSYANFESVPGKFSPNQYEAEACALLLWKIEHEGLSRDDKYVDLCLIEYDELSGVVNNPVWCAQEYYPVSDEVQSL